MISCSIGFMVTKIVATAIMIPKILTTSLQRRSSIWKKLIVAKSTMESSRNLLRERKKEGISKSQKNLQEDMDTRFMISQRFSQSSWSPQRKTNFFRDFPLLCHLKNRFVLLMAIFSFSIGWKGSNCRISSWNKKWISMGWFSSNVRPLLWTTCMRNLGKLEVLKHKSFTTSTKMKVENMKLRKESTEG